ncbi:Hypothetical protein GLP15_81 [Giardia lamblia P15]|uniref:Macrophage migration inhibitory factor n=1 Tax=Giardia intestinalis (strain P15) TaxID=658858 RepID=E1F8G0_GIAIA|nr:Hypothetical protein GLP15_81 [Giardia lamblia P15]
MAYAHITLSHEFPIIEMDDFIKCTTQAICDATGKPEAYILVTASRENFVAGLLPQSQIFVQLTIVGVDDPFRSEQISKFICRRLLLYKKELASSQVNIVITYKPRGTLCVCGNQV